MKKYIVIDIDGTLSEVCEERLKYLEKKDWDTFYKLCYKDKPIGPIVDLVQTLIDSKQYRIVFCTGRKDAVREETLQWLHKHLRGLEDFQLFMRRDRDWRHDKVVKPEILEKYRITPDVVAFILEDRTSMVERWRELGYTCLQVADGDF